MTDRRPDGYRENPGHGPTLRTDVVEVYIVRRSSPPEAPGALDRVEFLQLRRARDPARGTWQPVFGHIEKGERASQCALRELREETGLAPDHPGFVDAWALEQVHPYYIDAIDSVVLSPRFVVEAAPGWEPTLDDAHDSHRWLPRARARDSFLWPGQRAALDEIIRDILPHDAPLRDRLRLPR